MQDALAGRVEMQKGDGGSNRNRQFAAAAAGVPGGGVGRGGLSAAVEGLWALDRAVAISGGGI